MKRTVHLLSKVRHRSLSRLFASPNNENMQGIREKYDEYEVRLYFDEWLKSL